MRHARTNRSGEITSRILSRNEPTPPPRPANDGIIRGNFARNRGGADALSNIWAFFYRWDRLLSILLIFRTKCVIFPSCDRIATFDLPRARRYIRGAKSVSTTGVTIK
jgi:hypothetical protein